MKAKLIIIIFIMLFLIVAFPVFIRKNFPKEYFTEIYFNNPENLPKELESEKEYNFSFTIVSHEEGKTNYNYNIQSEFISESGKITLFPEENKTTKMAFKTEEMEERLVWDNLTVVIKHDGEEQSIYFFYRPIGK